MPFDAGAAHITNALRPRDAATLVLVDRSGSVPRVLMGQRHSSMAFHPGKFVFPGGRIDPGDQRVTAAGELRPDVLAMLTRDASPARARGLALAAIRETFEETGMLVGERSASPPRTRSPAWSRFFSFGVVPRLDVLELIARAVTPPNRPRRFDARFFMADARTIAHRLDEAENDELLTPRWLTLAEAHTLDLPNITRRVLDEVEARLHGPAHATRPVPYFRFLRGKPSLVHI